MKVAQRKRTQSYTRDVVHGILIDAFGRYLSIVVAKNIADDCSVRVYFYVQGLRDVMRSDGVLQRWPTPDSLRKEVIDLLLTLSQYSKPEIVALKEDVLQRSKRYFPDLRVPFVVSVLVRRYFGHRTLYSRRD